MVPGPFSAAKIASHANSRRKVFCKTGGVLKGLNKNVLVGERGSGLPSRVYLARTEHEGNVQLARAVTV